MALNAYDKIRLAALVLRVVAIVGYIWWGFPLWLLISWLAVDLVGFFVCRYLFDPRHPRRAALRDGGTE